MGEEKIHGFEVFVPDQLLGDIHLLQKSILIGFYGETEVVRNWAIHTWKTEGKLRWCDFF